MTCYLPPCCNLSSSPIRQPLAAPHPQFHHPLPLFRDPGFHRDSSTSVRRTVKSQPFATSAEVPLSRVLPSSRRPIVPFFLRFLFRLVLVSRALFFLGCKFALAKNHERGRSTIAEFRLKTQKRRRQEETSPTLSCSQNKQSASGRRHPCHGPDLFLLFVFVSKDTVIFFRERNGRSMSDEALSVRRGIYFR